MAQRPRLTRAKTRHRDNLTQVANFPHPPLCLLSVFGKTGAAGKSGKSRRAADWPSAAARAPSGEIKEMSGEVFSMSYLRLGALILLFVRQRGDGRAGGISGQSGVRRCSANFNVTKLLAVGRGLRSAPRWTATKLSRSRACSRVWPVRRPTPISASAWASAPWAPAAREAAHRFLQSANGTLSGRSDFDRQTAGGASRRPALRPDQQPEGARAGRKSVGLDSDRP